MVGDLVDGKRPKANFDTLATLGKHCSELEKRATEAERELTKLKLLGFMEKRIGETITAVITGVESFGIFVQGIEVPAEGLLPVTSLPPDSYQYERESRLMTGFKEGNQFRLGDQIRVTVAKVDLDQRLLEYEIADREPGKSSSRGGKGRSGSPSRDASEEKKPKDRAKSKSKDKSKSKLKPKAKPKSKAKTKTKDKGKSKAKSKTKDKGAKKKKKKRK
jgi:ribonuclease R